MPSVIVIGIGSDIGRELAIRFAHDGWSVTGTFRGTPGLEGLPSDVSLIPCDLTSAASIAGATQALTARATPWELLIVAAGTEDPIGTFWECDADAWDENVRVNALSPLRIVRSLYPLRNQAAGSSVAFFSGAGTNSAAPSYSAYCAAKVLLIKMCELLDAESPDTSFFIIGPGIVRTKIHEQTLRAPEHSGANYRKVVDFLASEELGTSHDDIYACLRWCASAGKAALGGRNVSLVYDSWAGGGAALLQRLRQDANLYKLRRFGNEMTIPAGET
jgi:NAD(P)-dependent dehydrogenase (short-subunit alcohol dehydrogenase family)